MNENLLSGSDRIVFGLVSSSSDHGELKSEAYDFDHNNLRNVQETVNSDQQITVKYDVDFANDKIFECFYGMFSGMCIAESDNGIDVSERSREKLSTSQLFGISITNRFSQLFPRLEQTF